MRVPAELRATRSGSCALRCSRREVHDVDSRNIFISYRRADARADAGRLYDRLHLRYADRVFRDVGSLEPGVEWQEAIDRVLATTDVFIVVIGPGWLSAADANGKRRID